MHNATLVWITPKVEELITYCARVSNPKNQSNMETAPKLIRYLLKHKHLSPFEMANMTVEINTSRAVSPQILRHRSLSFQEFSLRYSDVRKIGSPIPLPHLRRQDSVNRQASHDDLDPDLTRDLDSRIDSLYEHASDVYGALLDAGVAKECAREVLPLGVPTRLYANGTIRSWLTYIALREKNGTQLEHQLIALACKAILCEHCPAIAEALGGPEAPWVI